MSGQENDTDILRDDPMIAAEYALGLLEDEELDRTLAKFERDEAFAWRRDWWNNWFSPWTDEIVPMEPGPEVWQRIERDIAAAPSARTSVQSAATAPSHSDSGQVVMLERRVRRWQWAAGITSAAAALLLAVLLFTPGADPVPSDSSADTPALAVADPLVASIPVGDTRLGVTYLPATSEMLVSASGLTGDGVHDHELWVVPADGGELQSLGVIAPGEERRVAIPQNAAQAMDAGVELVLTREPIGGKLEGEAAGPVVAQGSLSQV